MNPIPTRTKTLRERVRHAYSAVADAPHDAHPFPTGREFATSLGYSEAQLGRLPATALDSFAGVSCMPAFAELEPGDRVLDLGCGAGLDTVIASESVGPEGRVVAVDFSEPMLDRARSSVSEAGVANVECLFADAESLPFPDQSFDKALVNGIFNLNADRADIFRELSRVMRPGGVVYAAELILSKPLPHDVQVDEREWFR